MAIEKEEVRNGPFGHLIADGVRVGDTIYLSGQVSMDAEGAVVAAGDLVAQTRQAYAHIQATLAEFGATMDNIVDETFMVTDMADAMAKIEPLFAARSEAYGAPPRVAQTMVQVAGLVMPELLVEIKVVAKV